MHFKIPISQSSTFCLVPYVSFDKFSPLNKRVGAWKLESIPWIIHRADATTLQTNHSFHFIVIFYLNISDKLLLFHGFAYFNYFYCYSSIMKVSKSVHFIQVKNSISLFILSKCM